MSYEAWGTPPDPEPRYCPLCDQESHSHDCELGEMQARAFLAEGQRDELLAAAEAIETDAEECLDFDECTAMLVQIDDYHKLMEAIASVKEK